MKLIIIGRRAPGISRQACHRHLRDVHGQLVVFPPADAGAMPGDYVQNHVIDGVYPTGDGPGSIERDLVTEIWFDDFDHLRASTETAYYRSVLKPDEPRFVDERTVEKLPVRPTDILAGENPGLFKVFIGVSFLPNTEQDHGAAATSIATALSNRPGVSCLVQNTVLPGPGGMSALADLIFEGWFHELRTARTVFEGYRECLRAECINPLAGFAVLAEQFDKSRLLEAK